MLLTAWKHAERKRHKNRKDYLLLFEGFFFDSSKESGSTFFTANLVTILKALKVTCCNSMKIDKNAPTKTISLHCAMPPHSTHNS
jgi:hypothetical protein